MTRAGRKTDAATTLLMVLLILTAVKLLLERLLALMLPHDLHQNTRLLLSMAQEALLIGLPALLMRRGRSARTGTMRLSIGLLLCAAVLGLAMRALATPLTLAEMRTGNLLVPMVMHAVYNASALFWRGMSAGWLIFCGAAVLALGIWALMTLPRTAKMRMKRGHIMLSAAILLLMAVQYLLG